MRLATFFAAALTAFASAANAALIHTTCTQGASPNLRMMCYAGFNNPSDFIAYDYADAYCRATNFEYSSTSLVAHQTRLPTPTLRIIVGCPEGRWQWYAITRTKNKSSPVVGQWVEWFNDGGSEQTFSCTN